MSADERVLCVPNATLEEMLDDKTLLDSKKYRDFSQKLFIPSLYLPLASIAALADNMGNPIFLPRSQCESDQSYRQICSYVVVNNNGKILRYRRTKQGAEGRLHGNLSIGIGGHINDSDFTDSKVVVSSTLQNAVYREIIEEIPAVGNENSSIYYRGLIYIRDSQKDVDLVHAGLVFELFYDGVAKPGDDGLANLESLTLDRLKVPMYEAIGGALIEYETWSRILLDILSVPTFSFFGNATF